MHEAAMAQAILRTVLEEAGRRGATAVRRIEVTVGSLDGVRAGPLRDAFALEAAGTPAEGAILDVNIRATVARCAACGREWREPDFDRHADPGRCPECGDDLRVSGAAGVRVERATLVTGSEGGLQGARGRAPVP